MWQIPRLLNYLHSEQGFMCSGGGQYPCIISEELLYNLLSIMQNLNIFNLSHKLNWLSTGQGMNDGDTEKDFMQNIGSSKIGMFVRTEDWDWSKVLWRSIQTSYNMFLKSVTSVCKLINECTDPQFSNRTLPLWLSDSQTVWQFDRRLYHEPVSLLRPMSPALFRLWRLK